MHGERCAEIFAYSLVEQCQEVLCSFYELVGLQPLFSKVKERLSVNFANLLRWISPTPNRDHQCYGWFPLLLSVEVLNDCETAVCGVVADYPTIDIVVMFFEEHGSCACVASNLPHWI